MLMIGRARLCASMDLACIIHRKSADDERARLGSCTLHSVESCFGFADVDLSERGEKCSISIIKMAHYIP